MSRQPVLLPYRPGSASARLLARALGAKRVLPNGRYVPRKSHLVVNWGYAQSTSWSMPQTALNHPEAVAIASNKLTYFQNCRCRTVPWTENPSEACAWERVVIRHKLRAHSGDGIEICQGTEMAIAPHCVRRSNAPLYTKYVKRKQELRVHVFDDNVFYVQVKRRRRDRNEFEENPGVRNLASGWVYCELDLAQLGRDTIQQARDAVSSINLDFGAVDILIGSADGLAYVLEVNTAPGLSDSSAALYAEQIGVVCRE